MSRRVSFTLADAKAEEVEAYARDHGYGSAGDFARVATLRIMSMYPSKKPTPDNQTADGEKASPGVPHERQDETSEAVESRQARAS